MRPTFLLLLPLLASTAGAGGVDSLSWVSEAGGVVTRNPRGSVTAVDLRATWAGDSDLASLAALPAMTRLDLSETRITDHGLRQLKSAPAITDLNLRYAELITDQGIAAMKTWKHLTRLNLEGTKITDSALQQISTFTSLEALNIGSVQVTDAGLESLTSLTKLRELTLGGDKLTDAGLQALRQLPGLTMLNLGGVQRTDSGPWFVSLTQPGVEAIATLQALRRLRLQQTLISARGLDTIKGLAHLEVLDLHDCGQVGDDALPALAAIPALRVLDLTGTKVSTAGLEKFRRDRPDCRILHAASTPKHEAGTVEMN